VHDQPEEQTGLEAGERQVADLVDDQDLGVGQLLEAAFQPALLGCSHQPAEEFLQGQGQHRVASLYGLDPQRDGQVGFPHAGRAEGKSPQATHSPYAGIGPRR
jgi:hypothetical protein